MGRRIEERRPTQEGHLRFHYGVVHSVAASQLLLNPDPTPEQFAKWNRAPSREHPLVWTRRDGRKSLLIGATAGVIVGLRPQDGPAILDRILA